MEFAESMRKLIEFGIAGAVIAALFIIIVWLIKTFLRTIKDNEEQHREDRRSMGRVIERRNDELVNLNRETIRAVDRSATAFEGVQAILKHKG